MDKRCPLRTDPQSPPSSESYRKAVHAAAGRPQAPPGCGPPVETFIVEVGEPGLPRAPRGGGAEVGRRHVGQARLSVLDRWPRWVAVTPAKEWRQPAQRPKISRGLRRILTPWSSMPPSKGRSHRSGPAPLASRDPAESLGTAIGLALPDKGLDPSESQARPTSLRKRSPAFTTGREVASPALSSMMRARPAVLSGNGAKVHRAVKPGSR